MFTEEKINQTELRIGLTEAGLPNLWIPKEIKQVDKIPILSTGKIDFVKLKDWDDAMITPDQP